jgi:thioredoxin-related protein
VKTPVRIFIIILSVFFCLPAIAQRDTTTPPFKRFPTFPPAKLLLSDSATVFTKEKIGSNKAVFIMLFSPDCSHCQKSTEEIIEHKEQLRDIQIIMVTLQSIEKMREFIATYNLNNLPNLVVGKDINYITPVFYNIKNFPFFALYNKKGKLIDGIEGSLEIPQIIEIFKKHD